MNLLREYNVSSQLAVVPWGMLLYIGGNAFETKWELLSPQWNEIRSLIQIRNNLASSIKSSSNEVSITSACSIWTVIYMIYLY
jgi:hypothetical protein